MKKDAIIRFLSRVSVTELIACFILLGVASAFMVVYAETAVPNGFVRSEHGTICYLRSKYPKTITHPRFFKTWVDCTK